MTCPICKSEAPPAPSICPHCGFFISTIPQTHPTQADKLVIIVPMVIAMLIMVGVVAGFLYLKKTGALDKLRAPALSGRKEFAVFHGKVVQPAELHASGQLYFVPVGRQAVPAQSLAEYYDKKFDLQIKVLAVVPLAASACLPERKQCIAEEIILAMKRAYPNISSDLDSVMIALTDEDLYPRSLGWKFTYSYYSDYQFAVISTRRMDPTFWGDPGNENARVLSTRQMLTDYIAYLYFHIPRSYDPTSIMYQPLTPNAGRDDLFESDLHSEASANGRRGSGWPCLTFTYSHETSEITPWRQFVNDCYENANPRSTQQETFQIELAYGQFVQRSLDFQLDSTPNIAFRRAYLSQYLQPMTFGLGSNHRYDNWLLSDGPSKLSFIDIIHEDGERNHLRRVSRGIGFSSSVIFEDTDDAEELYGARMTWDTDHFKLALRDGSWFTYLPCNDGTCYWEGYEDSAKHELRFERDAHKNLQRLTASDGTGLQFQSDDQRRILRASDTTGHRVAYEYDPAGCLWRVHRADGIIETYTYDSGHRMTEVSIDRKGNPAKTILTNRYDTSGRVSVLTLPDGQTYRIRYGPAMGNRVTVLTVTGPENQVMGISIGENSYVARTTAVQFPAVSHTLISSR